MQLFFLFIINLLAIFCSCVISNKHSANNITRIIVSTKSPDRIVDNRVELFVNDFYISYFGQYLLYELPYHKTYEINNKLIYDSLKYEYFVYNTNNKFGYSLKNSGDSFKIKINADSILQTRAYGGTWDMGDIFKELEIKTFNKYSSGHSKITCRYTFNNIFYDSANFYYDKDIKDIKFSLSKSLDSANNSKLYKIEMFLRKDRAATALNLKDFYINSIEIKKVPVVNENELKKLFQRFLLVEKNELIK